MATITFDTLELVERLKTADIIGQVPLIRN